MKVWKLLVLLGFVFASGIVCFAQPAADTGRSTGSPNTIYHGTDLEQVDTGSGNLRITLPLVHLPGRGLDTDIVLSYNSKIWQSTFIPSSEPGILQPQVDTGLDQDISLLGTGAPGWGLGVPRMGWVGSKGDECIATDSNGNCIFDINHSTFLLNDGTRIALVNENPSGQPGTTPMWSFDGSYVLYTSRGAIYKDGVVAGFTNSNGHITQETLTDTSGNMIVCSFSGSNPSSCLDTVGRTITFGADPATGLPGTVTYLDSSGTSRSMTFHYTTFSLNYLYKDGNNCSDNGTLGPLSFPLLTSVTLANGLTYSFQYVMNSDGSTTGEISKIILPTGGYIRYIYGFGQASTDPNLFNCGLFQGNGQNRIVANRFVSPDGTSASEQEWTYGLTGAPSGNQVMTLTDPQGNSQVISRQSGVSLPFQTDYKDSTGTVRKSVQGTVVSSSEPNDRYGYTSAAATNPRYSSNTTILSDTNQQSQSTYTYSAYNNITEKDETDLGTGTPGSVLRKTTYTYLADSNAAYIADTVHILDRVTGVTVKNAAGTQLAQTTTSYDGGTLTGTSNIGQHDYTNFSTSNTVRGNPTQVAHWLNTTGGSLITTNAYNDVGNIIQTTDPNGNVASFSYADNYANGSPPQPTSAFPTQITHPVTNNVNHIERSQYYFNTGLVAATCGENFPSTTTCASGLTGTQPDYKSFTYDLLGRPLAVVAGDGGQTSFTYNEAALPINIVSTTKIDSTKNLVQTSVYDGLGRFSQSQLNSDPGGVDYVDRAYDSLGRLQSVSNPHRSASSPTDGLTQTQYDALGRVTQVTKQDGSVVTTQYDQTSSSSPNGTCHHHRRSGKATQELLGWPGTPDRSRRTAGVLPRHQRHGKREH